MAITASRGTDSPFSCTIQPSPAPLIKTMPISPRTLIRSHGRSHLGSLRMWHVLILYYSISRNQTVNDVNSHQQVFCRIEPLTAFVAFDQSSPKRAATQQIMYVAKMRIGHRSTRRETRDKLAASPCRSATWMLPTRSWLSGDLCQPGPRPTRLYSPVQSRNVRGRILRRRARLRKRPWRPYLLRQPIYKILPCYINVILIIRAWVFAVSLTDLEIVPVIVPVQNYIPIKYRLAQRAGSRVNHLVDEIDEPFGLLAMSGPTVELIPPMKSSL